MGELESHQTLGDTTPKDSISIYGIPRQFWISWLVIIFILFSIHPGLRISFWEMVVGAAFG